MWLANSLAKPDVAYEHIVEQVKFREFGPGPVEQWPLLHDDLYVCRIKDIALARTLRDAYEVGFRARKLSRPTSIEEMEDDEDFTPRMHEHSPQRSPDGLEKVTRISCDVCGEEIDVSGMDASRSNPFYYCKRCKKHGARFELCEGCLEVEMAQGDGKHLDHEIHPHFLRCQHSGLEHRRLSSLIAEDLPEIRRVFCDYCGELAGHCDTDDEVFTCPTCPKEHGVRFELCVPCVQELNRRQEPLNFGWDTVRWT